MRLAGMKVVTAAALVGACTLSGTEYGTPLAVTPPPNAVYAEGTTFDPNDLTITAGTTVTWTNQDPFTHSVIYSSGPDSVFTDTIPPGATFQHTFKTAGTYSYYCAIHGTPTTGMHAIVEAK